jgi:hypothetical protein
MTIQAQTADGVIHEFPDGTPDAVVDSAIKAYLGQSQPAQPAKPPSILDQVVGAAKQYGASIARDYNAADTAYRNDLAAVKGKLQAGQSPNLVEEAKPFLDATNAFLSPVSGALHQAFGDKPVALPFGINRNGLSGGDIAMMALPVAQDAALARPVAQAAKAAGVGADTMKATLAASNAGAPAQAAGAAQKIAGLKDPVGTVDALRSAKTAAYQAVDGAGLQYTPQAFGRLVDETTADLGAQNLNPMRTPKAASMLDDLKALQQQGHAPTLTQLDQLRQVVQRDVAGASDRSERFFGRRIIDNIDKFVEGTKPEDLAGGDPQSTALIGAARDANTRYRKVQNVLDAVEKAKLQAGSTGSGGNIENAIRQKLRGVLQNTPNLTDDEKAALREIVVGTPGQDALRTVGKLSPQGNGLMAALNLGGAATAGAFGGPVGGAAGAVPGVVGMVAKYLGDTATTRKVDGLIQLMARGGKRAAVKASGTPRAAVPYQPNAFAAVAPTTATTQAANALLLPSRTSATTTNPQR